MGEATENLWEKILADARSVDGGSGGGNGATEDGESGRSLIVLGNELCGKTSLIARLKAVDFDLLPNCLALDYTYMDMVTEDEDEYVPLGKVNVWQLSGNPHFGALLDVALKAAGSLESTAFFVCLAMDTPWTMAAALDRWLGLVAKVVERAEEAELNAEGAVRAAVEARHAERRRAMEESWRRYTDGGEGTSGDGGDGGASSASGPGEGDGGEGGVGEEVLMPLTEGALEINLGVRIVIVVCKADMVNELQSAYAYKDAHFDYIQQTLRKRALAHGAALFYTSAAQEGNTKELMAYLEHSFYGLPFKAAAQVVEKESVLVPAGWDSLTKIDVLSESSRVLTRNKVDDDGAEPPFESVIKEPFAVLAPVGGAVDAADAVEAEDDQAFLQRFREFIDSDPSGDADAQPIAKGINDLLAAGKKKTPVAALAAEPGPGRRPSLENILAGAKAAKADTPSGGDTGSAGSEDVLNSFFHSLLNKGGAASADQRSDVKKALSKE
ncbi:cytoplasmic dynein 1 light intermediate chain 1 [Thecamonas trahens ATCC 50062]|uniref:Dynein light intermediate chain n=1 Tax=Thecamonas trahens ATCC 50062 TaxID=461836 RepID=A0A0L0D6P5_THETB|nr:cytoplasmic dynein 1 light intermediate chain 1 [Thecamonas trahens ATCC 50062]KNC47870.1 cytoplasmic dynein 1 light intermediate chain 1 [Thecamonas trahens ATCC 50062]|eukprot:XP_013759348.1 cytoplasmic dynein 1 light intermediate chain 1 [Thecamonas trahens ATCC 50062]